MSTRGGGREREEGGGNDRGREEWVRKMGGGKGGVEGIEERLKNTEGGKGQRGND